MSPLGLQTGGQRPDEWGRVPGFSPAAGGLQMPHWQAGAGLGRLGAAAQAVAEPQVA